MRITIKISSPRQARDLLAYMRRSLPESQLMSAFSFSLSGSFFAKCAEFEDDNRNEGRNDKIRC